MTMTRNGRRSEVRHVVEILRTRWLVVVVAIVATALAAFFLTLRQTPSYVSVARVVLRSPLASPGANPNMQFNMGTESGVAASPAVAEMALEHVAVDAEDETELLSGLEVETGGTQINQILTFSYRWSDAQESRDRAQALASAYLEYRLDHAEDVVAPLQDELLEIQGELQDVRSQMGTTDDPGQLAQLQSRAMQLSAQILSLQERLGLVLPGALTVESVGDVVQPAQVPGAQVGPNPVRNGLLGLILGAIFGVGLALLLEALDSRVREPFDLEDVLGRSVLAVIPPRGRSRRRKPIELAIYAEPDSPTSQAFGVLRTAVQLTAAERGMRTFLVTSPDYGEGKTVITANLAVALAQSGSDVVIVSADLRRPIVELFFNCSADKGLASVVRSRVPVPGLLRDSGIPHLRLLPAGPVASNPSIVLGSDAVRNVLDDVKTMADIVLIEAPPVLSVPDAAILAPYCDMILLVADARSTTTHSVSRSVHQLATVRDRLIAGVLIARRSTQSPQRLDRSVPEVPSTDTVEEEPVETSRSA
jgi:capsular exopolysaccharide synthesis family protein